MFGSPLVRLGHKVTVNMIEGERTNQKRAMQTVYSRMLNSEGKGTNNEHHDSFVTSTQNLRFLNSLHSQVEQSASLSDALDACRNISAENQYQAAIRAKVVGELTQVAAYA